MLNAEMNKPVVHLLLRQAANINAKDGFNGIAPLHDAALILTMNLGQLGSYSDILHG